MVQLLHLLLEELLNQTSYDENAALAEEKHFLKDYTIPLVQLDAKQVILCFSHNHNSFDKKRLLNSVGCSTCNYAENISINDFIKEEEIKTFFLNDIDQILEDYKPGLPENKPDVIQQTKEISKKREEMMENMKPVLSFKQNDGKTIQMNKQQILQKCQRHIQQNDEGMVLSMMNDMLNLIKNLQKQNLPS